MSSQCVGIFMQSASGGPDQIAISHNASKHYLLSLGGCGSCRKALRRQVDCRQTQARRVFGPRLAGRSWFFLTHALAWPLPCHAGGYPWAKYPPCLKDCLRQQPACVAPCNMVLSHSALAGNVSSCGGGRGRTEKLFLPNFT